MTFSAPAAAQESVPPPAAQSAAADLLDRFLAEIKTLEADFEQELWTPDGELIEQASGTLALSRPNKFLWRYQEPYEQVLVADARNIWIYDVDLEQVSVTALDESASSSPAMLLSGDRAVREGFDVVETFSRDGLEWIRLAPNIEGTDYASVAIGFDGPAPRSLELVDGLDQVTRIELSDVELNPQLPADTFEFEVPEGADVIGTPG